MTSTIKQRAGPHPISIAISVALLTPFAQAGPHDGHIVSGLGRISQSGNTTTIQQSTQNLSLDWNSFNIGSAETVNFLQPSATAIAVNRILDTNGTQILGRLNANGQVFLINPNGIVFGRDAQVNVGGLVASTLDLADASPGGNTRTFSGDGGGSIVNLGSINAASGGYVALLGNHVRNQGVIAAQLGTVAMGAGSAATLTFNGDSLVQMQVQRSVLDSLAENGGLIRADGGMVLMTAGAKDALLASVVNNTGVIEARTMEEHDGVITLLGGMTAGTVQVAGTVDASAPAGGNGGFIETSAAQVQIASGAKVTTASSTGSVGNWLIDPVNYTIAPVGGDMTGIDLSGFLAVNDVTVQSTSGDVNVNDVVAWSSNLLTLNARNDINVNSPLNGSGTARLALVYGQGAVEAGNPSSLNVRAPVSLPAGNNYTTRLGSDGLPVNYTVITSLGVAGSTGLDLQGIGIALGGNYALGSDIDASATSGWENGAGFLPVGVPDYPFEGILDGLGHTISHLTINRPGTDIVGLFGATYTGSVVRNLGVIDSNVTGASYVGALVGHHRGLISNSYTNASVTGLNRVGGLVGHSDQGTIIDSHSTGAVGGEWVVGGLAGGDGAGTIRNSYATGTVSAIGFVGGLLGVGEVSVVANSYATGTVTGSDQYMGGLVGYIWGSSLSTSYATGAVSGSSYVGGLIGFRNGSGPSNIVDSYWNTASAAAGVGGGGDASGVVGLTAAQLRTASSFTGLTFTGTPGATGNNWVIVDVDGNLNNASALGATFPMLASEYSSRIVNAHQLQLMAMAPTASYSLGSNIDATGTASGLDVWGNTGFAPIGNLAVPFTGDFNGSRHTISNLHINLATANVGLFGHTEAPATIRNVGILGGSISGGAGTGALVGNNTTGTISNSNSTINIAGGAGSGGLVGSNTSGSISNSYATGSVTGAAGSGGLVGSNTSGAISNSFATGNVVGAAGTGGLVGSNTSGPISDSYATGSANGAAGTGGLIGSSTSGLITNTYATGLVTSSGAGVGGLIGAGTVGAVSNSYWDTQTSNQAVSPGGGAGRTSAQMKQQVNFLTWDFTNTWFIIEGLNSPFLQAGMTAVMVTANGDSKTYNGLAYSGGNGVTYSSPFDNGAPLGSLSYGGNAIGAINAGSYLITPGGLLSDQRYLFSFTSGAMMVSQAPLTAVASSPGKVYDGSNTAAPTLVITSGLVGTQTIGVTGAGTFNAADVLTANLVTVNSTTLEDGTNGGLASNYSLAAGQSVAAAITPKALTATAAASSKTYNGNATAAPTLSITGGLVGSETVTATGAGTFNSKDVLAANLVTVNSTALADGTNGGLASNYSLASGQTVAASMAAKVLTATAGATNKVYDGDVIAMPTFASLAGLIGTETVTATGVGTFNTKDVITADLVTVNSTTLANGTNGGLASNYSLAAGQTVAANITPKALTAAAASSKTYNGNATAAPTLNITGGLVGSETVTATGAGTYNSKDVLTANLVTINSTTLDNGTNGGLASNYTLGVGQTAAASITAANLVIRGVTADDKEYDATTVATLAGTASVAPLTGDSVNVTGSGSGAFVDKEIGTAKAVVVSGFTLAGADADNYAVAQPQGVTASIVAAAPVTPPVVPVVPPVMPIIPPVVPVVPGVPKLRVIPAIEIPTRPITTLLSQYSVDRAGASAPSGILAISASCDSDNQPGIRSLAPALLVVKGGVRLPADNASSDGICRAAAPVSGEVL